MLVISSSEFVLYKLIQCVSNVLRSELEGLGDLPYSDKRSELEGLGDLPYSDKYTLLIL